MAYPANIAKNGYMGYRYLVSTMIKMIESGIEKSSAHDKAIRLLRIFRDKITPLMPRIKRMTEYSPDKATVAICSVLERWNHQPVGREKEKYMDVRRRESLVNCIG